jgi:hypothetical protein
LEEVEAHKGREPKPVWTVVVSQSEAHENNNACKGANDAFHGVCLVVVVVSVNVRRDHCPENHPVKGADVGIAGQRTGATRTADEFVISESEDSSDEESDDNSQGHYQ